MITPEQIKLKALRYWEKQRVLRAQLSGEMLFPVVIPFRKPTSEELLKDFGKLREWLTVLRESSKEKRGYGYTLTFRQVNLRTLGRQLLPKQIRFETVEDLCQYIGKQEELERWKTLVNEIETSQPALRPWLEKFPIRVIESSDEWPQLLAVLSYFQANPRPGLYLRELDIHGVHTKFIEERKGLFQELLDCVLPPLAIDTKFDLSSGSGFERRYGLKYDESHIRVRWLDPAKGNSLGISDLVIRTSDFVRLRIACNRIFITENKTNGLAFPESDGSIIIFGLGYGISMLKEAAWLRDHEVFYWGDIDTHGFSVLSRLRSFLPMTKSFLMDRETLQTFQPLWTREPVDKRFIGKLENLTSEEEALYEDLCLNRLGTLVRLEQERIPFGHLLQCVEKIPKEYS